MIYKSNLTAPDLQPFFAHTICRPMKHSYGHDVLSDWGDKTDDDPVFGIYKECGFWTHDEAAILFHVAERLKGQWLDIGAHTGWTTAHLIMAHAKVTAIDPLYSRRQVLNRAEENLAALPYADDICPTCTFLIGTSAIIAAHHHTQTKKFSGVVIDADHDRPWPLTDSQNALAMLAASGAILLHDTIGAPVQEGVRWLIEQGISCKIYYTPHVIACCWRGDFDPPDHEPDPRVKWAVSQYLGDLNGYA